MAVIWCFPAMKMNLRRWLSCKGMVFVCVTWSFDDMGLRERRTFIRVELPVRCTIVFAQKKIQAECINISATGMSVRLKNEVLAVNDKVTVILDDDSSDVPSLNTEAVVVRIIDAQARQYGLQFANSCC